MSPTTLPLPVSDELLQHASRMRQSIENLLGKHIPTRMRLLLYYQHLEELVKHAAMVAIDLTVDIAFLVPDDPRVAGPQALPNLVMLDPEALAPRVWDMIGMRSRGLN